MDHCDLLIVDTKSFAVGKTPNGGELVHENDVFVFDVDIDGVQIRVEHLVVHWVLPSLLKSEVVNSTKDFEEVLYDIVRCVELGRNWQIKLVSLLLDHGGGDCSLSTISIMTDHPKVTE